MQNVRKVFNDLTVYYGNGVFYDFSNADWDWKKRQKYDHLDPKLNNPGHINAYPEDDPQSQLLDTDGAVERGTERKKYLFLRTNPTMLINDIEVHVPSDFRQEREQCTFIEISPAQVVFTAQDRCIRYLIHLKKGLKHWIIHTHTPTYLPTYPP